MLVSAYKLMFFKSIRVNGFAIIGNLNLARDFFSEK